MFIFDLDNFHFNSLTFLNFLKCLLYLTKIFICRNKNPFLLCWGLLNWVGSQKTNTNLGLYFFFLQNDWLYLYCYSMLQSSLKYFEYFTNPTFNILGNSKSLWLYPLLGLYHVNKFFFSGLLEISLCLLDF